MGLFFWVVYICFIGNILCIICLKDWLFKLPKGTAPLHSAEKSPSLLPFRESMCESASVRCLLGSASLLRAVLVSFEVHLSAWYKGENIIYSSHIRVVVVVWEIIAHLSAKIKFSNILFLSPVSGTFTPLIKGSKFCVCLMWAPLTQRFMGICYDYDSWIGCGSSWHYNLSNDSVHTNSLSLEDETDGSKHLVVSSK